MRAEVMLKAICLTEKWPVLRRDAHKAKITCMVFCMNKFAVPSLGG